MDPDLPKKAFVSTSPMGLAIRDPGVLTKSQSFTETDFENRHTVKSGIGKNLFISFHVFIEEGRRGVIQLTRGVGFDPSHLSINARVEVSTS